MARTSPLKKLESRLLLLSLLSSAICLAQRPGVLPADVRPELKNIAAQLASVRRQELSIEVQRISIAKQVAVTRRVTKSGAFIEPLHEEAAQAANCVPLPPRESENLILEAAFKQSISPDLLRAVIRQESGFKPCALSAKGAQGLMQLMPETAAAFNVSNPFDAHQNILGGAAYLQQLMERYSGDASLALSAYNAGPQRVDREQGIPAIPETQNYVASIFRDLGWTMQPPPATMTSASLEEPLPEADVKPDGEEEESSGVGVDILPAANPLPEKPASTRQIP